jgi:ketosteroid isomerase-like protein
MKRSFAIDRSVPGSDARNRVGDTGPMSKENVELMRSRWEPFEGVNLAAIVWDADAMREALVASYSPDIELTTLVSGLGSGVGVDYRGIDGLVRYLREWFDPFSEYYVENLEYIDRGECVVVPTRQRGTGQTSGIPVELELTQLFEVRDGLIVRWHQYDTTEAALADADRVAAG